MKSPRVGNVLLLTFSVSWRVPGILWVINK
jgi:hypothetical protein